MDQENKLLYYARYMLPLSITIPSQDTSLLSTPRQMCIVMADNH